MKIRNSYVSNSSSSSYIIAYDKDAELKFSDCEISFTMDDFMDFIDRQTRNWSSDETCISANGDENVYDYEKSRLSGYDIDEDKKYMDELEKFMDDNKGREFSVIRISYHDDFVKKMYNAFKSTGKIVEFREQEE